MTAAGGGRGRSFADELLSDDADHIFTALADSTRRRIVVRLAAAPDDAGSVARDLNLSRQAVAKHLGVLERAGIVRATFASRRRVHWVAPTRLSELSELLGLVARGWDRRLEEVKARAEAGSRKA